MSPFDVTVTRMTDFGKETSSIHIEATDDATDVERMEGYVMAKMREDPNSIIVVGPRVVGKVGSND